MKKLASLMMCGSLLALPYSLPLNAAPAVAAAAPSNAAIVFVNGINNTFDDAVANLQVLKTQLNARNANNAYVYGNAYNATQGAFSDLYQVFKQKAVEGSSPADFWRAVDGDSLPASGMDAALEQKYIDILTKNEVPELPDHLNQYRAYLKQKRGIVLVGHSQGSLYANFETNVLITGPEHAQGRISTVNVGNAARYLLPGSSYLTSSSDAVIGSLGLVQTVLPANFSMGVHLLTDPAGHSFSKIYMNPSFGSASQILTQVSQQANSASAAAR
ncbi:hypothetical protein EFP18_10690 [Burkholderia glumae]|uniref:hypothetical protein n=1 Tax=Burkholderia glumae TaxID=337 RepID=UPI00039BA6A1|nr:hypothetical protein [Burkholderia glumae]MCM2493719.1 DUF3089 domain-containing protein [Burkholderia glumae]MCM2546914.1 DUF3089 domain-containing protein [Burkholderia glumae]MCM2552566.1 DUF3089 domain-containing protein [Burkholderia glumae]MCQ0034720.1 DUF3089 domain-containing protein [Burkholderia glumae]MCQ0040442.1 DUF3089 domain-containing protein [Burkholderia glumae]